MANEILYPEFKYVIEKLYSLLRQQGAISFQRMFSHDSSKGYFFCASFKDKQYPDTRTTCKYFYVKWESAPSYKTIWREVEELHDARDGGKTMNEKILQSISPYPNLSLVFSDPYAVRIIDWDFFMINSYPFKQAYNDEQVRGIDINKLVNLEKYLSIGGMK